MVENKLLTVSAPPHIYGNDSIERRMRDVLIALTPAMFFAIYFYGVPAIITTAIAVISAMAAEFLFQRIMNRKSTVGDYSAALTGLLLAFNLPPAIPLWIPVLGSFFAIIVVKQLFGGLGSNFMNPALAARAFLLTSFPVHMTSWTLAPDAVTGATYLGRIKHEGFIPQQADYMNLLFGNMGGTIGEVSAAALIAGGIYLLVRRVINWRIPVFYIGSFVVFGYIFARDGLFNSSFILFEVLAGGLLLGAIYMATDYATAPISHRGRIIFAIGCGFLTVMFRFHGGYPEGVSYAILIMNLFVPMIDKYVRPSVYGKGKKKA